MNKTLLNFNTINSPKIKIIKDIFVIVKFEDGCVYLDNNVLDIYVSGKTMGEAFAEAYEFLLSQYYHSLTKGKFTVSAQNYFALLKKYIDWAEEQ